MKKIKRKLKIFFKTGKITELFQKIQRKEPKYRKYRENVKIQSKY